MDNSTLKVFTVGHSTRPIEDFIELLQGHHIEHLIDVRTIPRSRHNPQFEKDALAASLQKAHIDYSHAPALGGLRHTRADSPNKGWHNSSFRGFADYMQTPEFIAAVDELVEQAKSERIALMCAEAVPWRCHRSMIGDALLIRGVEVCEISSPARLNPIRLTSFAQVKGKQILYPPEGARS